MPASKRVVVLAVVVWALVGCAAVLSRESSAATAAPVEARAQTQLAAVSVPPTAGTPSPQVFFPIAQKEAPCETHTASLALEATATILKVGDAVTVTATLTNEGCANLGLPQYRLMIESGESGPIFDPDRPEPVTHSVGIGPGHSDSAEFALRAVRPGAATLTASVSYEVHLGYPGPAYWSASGAGPLAITVAP